ncbi:MAG TPA: hypothetical protein VGR31_06215 [Planctomycetota bacterium]|jgi:hypothetical protein|nr:hypothetical protein [Planctomycetota bacterium]
MAKQNLEREIHDRIASFLHELSGLVRAAAIESVHEALGEGRTPRRGPGRPRKAVRPVARAGKRVRRSAEDLEKIAARVLTHVKSKAGQRLEEIGRALNTETGVLKKPIAMLVAKKKLKTQGRKRGTKYFAK